MMTDKLISREEIADELKHCQDLKEMGLGEGCPIELGRLKAILHTGLAAHDIYAYVEQLEDQLVQTRAYYAQRDQRMREALHQHIRLLKDYNQPKWNAEIYQLEQALTSHPADNDASKFVEKIKGEVLRDLVSKWEANSNDSKGFETFDIRKFAAGHGIPLTSPTPEPDVEPHEFARGPDHMNCWKCGEQDNHSNHQITEGE